MKVREVAKEDYNRWLPLWDGYNTFYGRSGEKSLPAEITQTLWARFFDKSEPVYALVAEDNGKLVGLTHYLFHRSTTLIENICYLQDLFTAEGARGKGFRQHLLSMRQGLTL